MASPYSRRLRAGSLRGMKPAAAPRAGPAGILLSFLAVAASDGAVASAGPPSTQPAAIVKAEFIYETAPFPSCHASTIAQTKDGLAAAWFGGTDEGARDVGIWLALKPGKAEAWSKPVQVATGKGDDGKTYPCWNPVLFQPKDGPLLLFYKVGPRPSAWWGMLITSDDAGKTWSEPRRLPDGILGPVKNKPVQLADGTIVCGSSTEHDGWRAHVERTGDLGKTWTKTEPLNDKTLSIIQPAVLTHGDGKLQLLCRTRQKKIGEFWSDDGGKTWTAPKLTELPNSSTGIDAVTLKDGRHVLVYNHTPLARTPLNVAVSKDGKAWAQAVVLEDKPGEYSYPAVMQAGDGMVHVTYTWKRQRIRHVVIDPKKLP